MPDYSKPLNKSQRNHLDEMKAVHAVNLKYPLIMASNTKLALRNTELGTVITDIEKESAARDESRKGTADEKDQIFLELVGIGSKAAAAGRSLSRDLKNPNLFALCDYSKSKLENLKGAEIVPVFTNIYNVVNEHLEMMPGFGFPQSKVDLFNSKFDAFKAKYSDLKSDLSASEALTKKMKDLFEKGRLIQEDMDDLVEAIEDEYTDYYDEYQAARVIHNLGGAHTTTPETPPVVNPQ